MAPFRQTTLPAHLKAVNRGRGQPSMYRPEYCDQVIEAMSQQGLSLTGFAGTIPVSKDTVYEWIKRHADFSDAVSRARSARVTYLERKLMRARKGAETTAAIFGLRNADPDEWRDVRQVQHAHQVRIETLSDAQLYAIASGRSPGEAGEGATIDGECEEIVTR